MQKEIIINKNYIIREERTLKIIHYTISFLTAVLETE